MNNAKKHRCRLCGIETWVPTDAGGKEIHIILEVLDKHQEIGMYDYRRVVLEVI